MTLDEEFLDKTSKAQSIKEKKTDKLQHFKLLLFKDTVKIMKSHKKGENIHKLYF